MGLEDVIRYEKAGAANSVYEQSPEAAASIMKSLYEDFTKGDEESKREDILKGIEVGLSHPETSKKIISNLYEKFKDNEEKTKYVDLFNHYAQDAIKSLDDKEKKELDEMHKKYQGLMFKTVNARADASDAMKTLRDSEYPKFNFSEDKIKQQEKESEEYSKGVNYLKGFRSLRFNRFLRESEPSTESQMKKLLESYMGKSNNH